MYVDHQSFGQDAHKKGNKSTQRKCNIHINFTRKIYSHICSNVIYHQIQSVEMCEVDIFHSDTSWRLLHENYLTMLCQYCRILTRAMNTITAQWWFNDFNCECMKRWRDFFLIKETTSSFHALSQPDITNFYTTANIHESKVKYSVQIRGFWDFRSVLGLVFLASPALHFFLSTVL